MYIQKKRKQKKTARNIKYIKITVYKKNPK